MAETTNTRKNVEITFCREYPLKDRQFSRNRIEFKNAIHVETLESKTQHEWVRVVDEFGKEWDFNKNTIVMVTVEDVKAPDEKSLQEAWRKMLETYGFNNVERVYYMTINKEMKELEKLMEDDEVTEGDL